MDKPQIVPDAEFSGELFNISKERCYELADYFAEDCEKFMQNTLTVSELATKLLAAAQNTNEIGYICFTIGMLSEVRRSFTLDINLEGVTIEQYFNISPERNQLFIDKLSTLEVGQGKTPKIKYINGVLSMALTSTERLYLMYKATTTFAKMDASSGGIYTMLEKLISQAK